MSTPEKETAYSATKSGEAGNPTEPMLQGLLEGKPLKEDCVYINLLFFIVILNKKCYYNKVWKMNKKKFVKNLKQKKILK